MTSLTKNPQAPKQKYFFRVQTRRLAASLDASTSFRRFSCNPNRSRDIPVQSQVRLGVFLYPRKQLDAKELRKIA